MNPEDKVLQHLKDSLHNMGFKASMGWKCSVSNRELDEALESLVNKGLVKAVRVPVDYKNNIHYSLWTDDVNATEESLEGQVVDLDDFEELDSGVYELKPAYILWEDR